MPRAEQGFTLLEMLVALAVFSLAALALINLAGENARTAGVVEARTLAAVVAENRAVEAVTASAAILGESKGEEVQGGRPFAWRRIVSQTDDSAMLRVDVSVSEKGSAQTLAALTAFRGRP